MNKEVFDNLTLRFKKNPELEKKFLSHYTHSSKSFVMMGTFSAIAILASFYSVDYLLFSPIFEELVYFRSLNLFLIFIIVGYTFIINTKSNYLFWISFVGPIVTGIIHTHILAIAQEDIDILYFPGMILVMMYNFCFLKQRFVHATISSALIAIYFNIVLYNCELEQFILMNMFMISSIFIGLWVSYILELNTRNQFLLTQKLEHAIEDRKEIYKVVVHDLKNPVSIIKSQVHLLEASGKLDPKQTKRIFSSTDRMLYLLDHLLKFCEIEESETQIELQEFNIKELMDICIDNNIVNAQSKGINLEHHLPSEDLLALTDGFKTQEVLDNVLSNAIKYSEFNSAIDIFYTVSFDSIKVHIKDYGQGIDESEVPKVFNKFSKLSPVPTGGETSNGLGLSLSKNLMTIQGGDIICKSTKGKGSEFIVVIPKKDQF